MLLSRCLGTMYVITCDYKQLIDILCVGIIPRKPATNVLRHLYRLKLIEIEGDLPREYNIAACTYSHTITAVCDHTHNHNM